MHTNVIVCATFTSLSFSTSRDWVAESNTSRDALRGSSPFQTTRRGHLPHASPNVSPIKSTTGGVICSCAAAGSRPSLLAGESSRALSLLRRDEWPAPSRAPTGPSTSIVVCRQRCIALWRRRRRSTRRRRLQLPAAATRWLVQLCSPATRWNQYCGRGGRAGEPRARQARPRDGRERAREPELVW